MTMDINTMRSIVTVVAFLTFLAIVLWAYSGARKGRFEEAARLPFDEDEDITSGERR
jgi:cytochrome c oxidase cbb3-type subunit 4